MKDEAAERTSSAQDTLNALSNLLTDTLSVDDRIDWESLKDRSQFSKPSPKAPEKRSPNARAENPERPDPKAGLYQPKIDFLCWFSPGRKAAAVANAKSRYDQALLEWEAIARDLEQQWSEDSALAEREHKAATKRHRELMSAWEDVRAQFLATQRSQHETVDTYAAAVASGDEVAVTEACDLVLGNSEYPDFINIDYQIDYTANTKGLVVDFELPEPSTLPMLREVRYVQSRNEFDEKYISDAEKSRLYDSVIYQMALRTIHELFEADEHENIQRVTFNGWVSYVDRATGSDQRSCILSVGANREEFEKIDLSRVDPKECVKALKGVAASKLIGLAPVVPLERPRAADRRFVESQDVLSDVGDQTNLAAMHWEDFEHLVRQVFEAEFASANGEVRVTQASRDGGVDAVIFDPDPIRGGKIIVQAKRYTNVVDVSSVRDLYGTVQHEGASKGILVTTSQFGPDARKFAQDKPITLIDGGNLLHLLEKMGMKARINLAEAKALQKQSIT